MSNNAMTVTALARSKRLTIIAVRHPEDFSMTPELCELLALRLEIMRGLDNELRRHRAARDAEEIPMPY